MKISCISVTFNRSLGGFHLTALATDGFDSMWDRIFHPAVFKDEERARKFFEKVDRSIINPHNWILSEHPCADYQSDVNTPCFYTVI